MTRKARISIILTSFNRANFLCEAVRSVIAQTFTDWELVIVDDLSTDGAWEVAQDFAKADDRIRALQTDLEDRDMTKCCRPAHNINLVYPLTVGDYITYLNDDDWYLPNRLEVMLSYLESHSEVYIVYGQQQMYSDIDGRREDLGIRETFGILWNAANKVDLASVMHRRECWNKVGGFDESPRVWIGYDAAFWDRLNQYWPFYPIEQALDVHRMNRNSSQWVGSDLHGAIREIGMEGGYSPKR